MRMRARVAALLVGLALGARPAEAREDLEDLGSISFTIGTSGDTYGYKVARYGAVTGRWPGALFEGGAVTGVAVVEVSERLEDEGVGGVWTLAADASGPDWLPATALDAITVTVAYEDGRDTRDFTLGGFVVEVDGIRLTLLPPLPSRDWDSKLGEAVTVTFTRPPIPPVVAAPVVLVEPTAESGSFLEFLQNTTPGGGVVAQTMIVIIVFLGFTFTAAPTPRNILLASIVLVITPWIPVVIFGIGSTVAASIIFVNILTGAYASKSFAARTEA